MRNTLITLLRRLNRIAKRWLRVSEEAVMPAPATPDYLVWQEGKTVYTDEFVAGRFVFLLKYITAGSGGLADILFLGQALQRTMDVRVAYLVPDYYEIEAARDVIQGMNRDVELGQVVHETQGTPEFVCATAWPTAYQALVTPSHRKLYFIQDYEPWFRAAGVERYYAEKSHELGLEMFTLGPWLASHIQAEHDGARVCAMPFPMMDPPSAGTSIEDRKRIGFYVQPEKDHRGVELLLETARRVSRTLSENSAGAEIVMFGSDDLHYMKFDFPCRVVGLATEAELRDLLGTFRTGVSASFTNISLLPFRVIAAGGLAVDLDVPNVTANIPDGWGDALRCFAPTPQALAEGILSLYSDADRLPVNGEAMKSNYERHSWSACADVVKRLIERKAT